MLAFKLYCASADKHHLEAQMLVADILSGGTSARSRPFSSVPKDEALSLKYWEMAAAEPHHSAEAMYRMGRAALFGVKPSAAGRERRR